MPGGDRSGPMGRGSMTGWGRGFCSGPEAGRFERGAFGGWGRGYGRGGGGDGGGGGGWGWRNRFWATGVPGSMRTEPVAPTFADAEPMADTELRWLTQRAAALETEQEQIRARLSELNEEPSD